MSSATFLYSYPTFKATNAIDQAKKRPFNMLFTLTKARRGIYIWDWVNVLRILKEAGKTIKKIKGIIIEYGINWNRF